MGPARHESLAGRISRISVFLLAPIILQSCEQQAAAPASKPLHVVVTKATYMNYARTAALTGIIRPRTESALAFRTVGRMITRNVDVGDHVKAGDILAEIDATEQEASLKSADATLQSANAVLTQSQTYFDRMKSLLAQNIATQKQYDSAQESLQRAIQSVQGAKAQRDSALDDLTATKIKAPADGVITTRSGEPGQVVQAAQAVFKMADDGPRDVVFNLYEAILTNPPPSGVVNISLVANPSVTATATVREISPTVDQSTGTVEAKLVLKETPPEMKLGASVVGTALLKPVRSITLPWTAISSQDGAMAVWVVDPKTSVVSQKKVEVLQYSSNAIVVSKGLEDGDLVVTQGAMLLRPGQVVDPSQEATQ